MATKRVPLGVVLRECNYADVHRALRTLVDASDAMLAAGGWCQNDTEEGKAAAVLCQCVARARVTLQSVEQPKPAGGA